MQYDSSINIILIFYHKLTTMFSWPIMHFSLWMQYSVCSIQYSTFFEIAVYREKPWFALTVKQKVRKSGKFAILAVKLYLLSQLSIHENDHVQMKVHFQVRSLLFIAISLTNVQVSHLWLYRDRCVYMPGSRSQPSIARVFVYLVSTHCIINPEKLEFSGIGILV